MNDAEECHCFDSEEKGGHQRELRLHSARQDMNCNAWKRLVDLVERAADQGSETFEPAKELGWEQWRQIVTLPASISRLNAVRVLDLYGSNLARIPPEIGDMTALEVFDPYTSYRLHWFPFEITRCRLLKDTRVSTRALYGNYKFRPPFPRLPQAVEEFSPACCSVCRGPFGPLGPLQYWVSLLVAKDVLPLLAFACSDACVEGLPLPPTGYVNQPHQGGLELKQPARHSMYR